MTKLVDIYVLRKGEWYLFYDALNELVYRHRVESLESSGCKVRVTRHGDSRVLYETKDKTKDSGL